MSIRLRSDKKERIGLTHIGNYLNTISQPRMVYLGLIVIINISAYVGIYFLDEAPLREITGVKLFVMFILMFINWIFSVILLREHNLKKLTDRWFHNYLFKNRFNAFIDYKTYLNDNDDMRGTTWEMTKQLLAFFSAVPLAVASYFVLYNYLDIFETGSMSLGVFLILTGFFHLLYAGYFSYRER